MTQVVNLNKARKAKAKVQKRTLADANAAKFGRTKSQKAADEVAQVKHITHLDQHKRDT
ncbi:MAG: DUF4169 family protein [Planktomarina sp.]